MKGELRESLRDKYNMLIDRKNLLEGFNSRPDIPEEEKEQNRKELKRLRKEIRRVEDKLYWA